MPLESACSLQTGDLLLFSGRGFTSEVIRVFTRSPWSHIGMVVHLPGNPHPLVLESTTLSESPDVTLGRPVAGVALVPLADKLRGYTGTVALRRRHGPALSDRQQQLLVRLVKRLLHRPYKNYVLCNALDVVTGFTRRPDQRGWFCSELVAEMYRRLGWLPRDIRVAGFVPGDFDSPRLALREGALGEPRVLKAWKSATTSDAPVADRPATQGRNGAREMPLPPRSRGYA